MSEDTAQACPARLSGRTALVTGAARGIGRAIARRLAREGAAIVAVDTQADGLESLGRELRADGAHALTHVADVGQRSQIRQALDQADARGFSAIDCLVNNAAVGRPASFLEIEDADWQRMLSVNLTGTFTVAQEVARRMVGRGTGRIVNIGSLAAHTANGHQAAYAATKGAITALTRVVAFELAPLGIAVNSVCPGPIDTELALREARRLLAALPAPEQPTDIGFYLRHCVRACEAGIERSHILPYATDGALLMEVYTHDGIGTMVVDEKLESLREATPDDVGGILHLIEPFERDGTLVRRERHEIERDVASYTVIEHDGVIFGCAAMHPYPEKRTAEMAALTVAAQAQGQGDGERILKRIEQRARAAGAETLFVLTTRTMHWFLKRGFVPESPQWLPTSRLRHYSHDRRSQVLVKSLK